MGKFSNICNILLFHFFCSQNRAERMETEAAELPFVSLVSRFTLTGHVRNATNRDALQIYQL
jgi:hypothetical protein